MRVTADEESAAVDSLGSEPIELCEQHRGVHDDTVADDRRDVVVEDAAGHELQSDVSPPTTIVWPALCPPW